MELYAHFKNMIVKQQMTMKSTLIIAMVGRLEKPGIKSRQSLPSDKTPVLVNASLSSLVLKFFTLVFFTGLKL